MARAPSSGKVDVALPQKYTELLTKELTDNYTRTDLYSSDLVAEVMKNPHDDIAILLYKRMDHEQLWLDCAHKLEDLSLRIIEFAKMLPEFIGLPVDDQILLLNQGTFEMSILRMSRFVDPLTGYVMYGEVMIPSEAFSTADTSERKLVNNIFDVAKSIAELKLTESELALYSSCVLLSPDRPGLDSVFEVQTLNRTLLKTLRQLLDTTHKLPYKGDVHPFDFLMAKLTDLRDASLLHKEVLAKFRRSSPHLDFPALYEEMFTFH